MQLGEIAVINHADIDRVAAEGLIGAGVGAVLNAAPSITGRYPNGGPIRLVEAGILLVDDLGSAVMDIVEGQTIHVEPDGVVSSSLREIVAELSAGEGCSWAGIYFVEEESLVLGPQAGLAYKFGVPGTGKPAA